MNMFKLADVKYVDKAFLQFSLKNANFRISPEEIDSMFKKLPNNSKNEVSVKDVVRYLNKTGKRKDEKARKERDTPKSTESRTKPSSQALSPISKKSSRSKSRTFSRRNPPLMDNKEADVEAESESEESTSGSGSGSRSGSDESKDEAPIKLQNGNTSAKNAPDMQWNMSNLSESQTMDGFSDWQGNTMRSDWQGNTLRSTTSTSDYGKMVKADFISNQGFEFDCMVALEQVIMSLKNSSAMRFALTIQTLKGVKSRVQQYESAWKEFQRMKEDHAKLGQKCEALELEVNGYKKTIEKLELQLERTTQKRIDDFQKWTSNHTQEIQKHVKSTEKWRRKHGQAQSQISQLLLLSNKMNKKLEKKKKKRRTPGGGGNRRFMSTQLAFTDNGMEEKYEPWENDAVSVQMESMPSLKIVPESWSDKQRALSVGVNKMYHPAPVGDWSAPEAGDRMERSVSRRRKKKKKIYKRSLKQKKSSRRGSRETIRENREYSTSKKRSKRKLNVPDSENQAFSDPNPAVNPPRGQQLVKHRESRITEEQGGYIPGDEEEVRNPLTRLLSSPTQGFDDGESTVFSRSNKTMDVSLGAKDRW